MRVLGAALLGSAAPAYAVPPPPPNPTDSELGSAQAEQEAAAAEVGRIHGLVAGAEAELERVGDLAEAAGTAYLAAEEALQLAQIAPSRRPPSWRCRGGRRRGRGPDRHLFSRDSYMNGGSLSSSAALLDAEGPGELIQRAAMLDYVADNQLDVLGALEVAKVAQANADSAARAARDEMAAAEEAAEAAKEEADAQLAAQQGAYEQVAAQKAAYDEQLQAAQIQLLELQGARNAYDQWVAQKQAEEARRGRPPRRRAAEAAAAAAAAQRPPARGERRRRSAAVVGGRRRSRTTSPTSGLGLQLLRRALGRHCTTASTSRPRSARRSTRPHSGVVQRAGAATGFGLAVYIRGDDGAVTVYGHVNRYFVSVGERVSAGEQIAEVGNRGSRPARTCTSRCTPGGVMYGGQVNPVPWLNARGVYLGGCGGCLPAGHRRLAAARHLGDEWRAVCPAAWSGQLVGAADSPVSVEAALVAEVGLHVGRGGAQLLLHPRRLPWLCCAAGSVRSTSAKAAAICSSRRRGRPVRGDLGGRLDRADLRGALLQHHAESGRPAREVAPTRSWMAAASVQNSSRPGDDALGALDSARRSPLDEA